MREEQLPSAGGGVRPGSMTTAMRAVTPAGTGARLAVRIAVARRGRVEREWILEKGELTVGRSEQADVVDAALPFDRAIVLRVAHDGAELRAPGGARGRVQSGGTPRDIDELAGASLALDDTARGRLVLGSGDDEVAILFQRVPAPAARLRPALPLAVQQRLFDRVDWFFTAIAAASFMLHFAGIVALTEADWPVPSSLAEIDRHTVAILYPEETLPPEVPEIDDPTTTDETETPVAETPVQELPTHRPSPREPRSSPSPSPESIEDVHQQVALAVEMMIGAMGSDGSLRNLLDEGGPTVSQGDLLADVNGVEVASIDPGTLLPRDSGHSTQPGPIGTLRRGQTDGEHREGTELVEHPVHVTIVPDDDGYPEPMDPNWDERLLRAAVQRRMGAIQRCYEVELTRNPELAGRVTVSMQVEEIGTLSHVHTEDDTTGSRTLGECVVGQIRSIRLQSGPEGGLVAEYPIVFAPQR